MKIERISISIGLGNRKIVGLNDKDELIFQKGDDRRNVIEQINLGSWNQKGLDDLCEYIQRLKIHVPV